MYYNEPKTLFATNDGLHARRNQVAGAAAHVDRLSEADLAAKTDDEILAGIQKALKIEIPVLKQDDISFERQTRTMRWRNHFGDEGEREVPAFIFTVPFSGNPAIFTMQPSTSGSAPQGEIKGNSLLLTALNEEDPQKLKQTVDAMIGRVEAYLGWHRQMWNGIENEIAQAAQQRLNERRSNLAKLTATETGLADLGFKPKKP